MAPLRRAALALALTIGAVLTAPIEASADTPGDWTQFRNAPDQTGVNVAETSLSTTTVNRLRQRWVNKVGGSVWSTPAVVDGTLYIASVDDGRLHAISVTTGQTLWTAPPDALTSDWTFTSPTVANGIVYLGINRPAAEVWAFDARSGATMWRTGASFSNIVGSPTVADGVVYVTTTADQVLALDAATGTRIWDVQPGGGRGSGFYSAPTVALGLIFVTSLNHNVYALKSDNGEVVWTFTTGGINASSPAVSGGLVYLSSRDGNVYALDVGTGAARWQFRYGSNILASFQSSPAVADGVVYVGTNNDRRVIALDAATGRQRWSARTGGIVMSSPVVANGVVYIGSDDRSVNGFATANGRKLWSARVAGAVDSGPVVSNGMVFAGTYGDTGGGNVYAFGLP
jgi:eukaryotic-like serine/threonine-protein kinase